MQSFTLEFKLDEPFGRGKNTNPESALIRPFRKFSLNGSPIGKFIYIFYQEGNNCPTNVLGTLLYSEQGRIIFFPGLVIKKHHWSTKIGKHYLIGKEIDHITLEPDRKNWHMTSIKSSKRDSYKTYKIAPKVWYWFGLSVRNKTDLEITPAQTICFFPSIAKTDVKRRTNALTKSREKSKFINIRMDESKPDNNFIHFDFIIDQRKFYWLRSKIPLLKSEPPSNPPALISAVPSIQNIRCKWSKIKIPTFPGNVSINTSFQNGQLSSEAILTEISKKPPFQNKDNI